MPEIHSEATLSSAAALVPLTFAPYLRPQPWGNRRLETVFGRPLPATGRYGESWELSGHAHHISQVASGPLAGVSLLDLWKRHQADWIGRDNSERFPWLLKFLDCHEFVSVQVHPKDDLARRLCPSELGKSEAWVIVAAEPGARIYAGLLPGVSPADVEAHVRAGTLVDCLHSFEPRVGDCVSLPAGTVHSLGGGILVAEVQQTSDATFRLFDWNRPGLDGKPRPLHLREALAAIDWELGPVSPLTPVLLPQPATCVSGSELLIENEYFRWERYVARAGDWQISNDRLAVWTVIHGRATLAHGGSSRLLHLGESLLIPPSTLPAQWSFDGPTTLLKVTAPLAESSG